MGLIDILNTGVLALIMLSIGASLTVADFRRVLNEPKTAITGLLLQMVFLPLLAFLLLQFSHLDPYLKVGILIVALCPGGTTSNFISYLVGADIALSISLTTVNSLIILVTIPVFANLGLTFFLGETAGLTLPIGATVAQVFGIILLPVMVGVWFNETYPSWSKRLETPLKYVNILLLALVFGIRGLADQESGGSGLTFHDFGLILPMALAIHSLSMLGSYGMARWLNYSNVQSVTIGIEVGLQNTALALLVSGTLIGNETMMKPAIVFGLFTFFTTLAFGWFGVKKR